MVLEYIEGRTLCDVVGTTVDRVLQCSYMCNYESIPRRNGHFLSPWRQLAVEATTNSSTNWEKPRSV
jgi:hypothetical protein